MSNKLIHETSPYLLQHAHNPVHWYPWGDEALQKARAEDKPIFLSIGYAACHWCHVMAHESFENNDIAMLMNQHYVNIKVDREERPDLDAIYMNAVTALTGRGGWPMSVWLTPQGVPFYAGTYFPPTDRMGMPGFDRLLEMLAQVYSGQKDTLNRQGEQLLAHMRASMQISLTTRTNTELDPALPEQALQALAGLMDYTHGGLQGAPKFPQAMIYDFLLRAYHLSAEPVYLKLVELTLRKMADGGIYDHLGGGFHRYATDETWLAPHFEKMLYDNALLARLYLHAFQVTGNTRYRQVVEETLDYVIREMTDPLGGFYASQDADSEGEEGKFFIWTPAEIETVLGQTEAGVFCAAYDVTPAGNWQGKSILRLPRPLTEVAAALGLPVKTLWAQLARNRSKLLAHRQTRVKPARDEKILTAWNGLMLAAFAEAARVLDRPDYLAVAQKNAAFLLSALFAEGRLLRSWKAGQAKLMGYLEDYTFLADGLLALYQTSFEEKWFVAARQLMDTVLARFSNTAEGGFFDTAADHETLVVRPKTVQDNAVPSGNAMAARNLLWLAACTGEETYYRPAVDALQAMQPLMREHPSAFAHWLGALTLALTPPHEIAVIGAPEAPETQPLLAVLQKPYRPNQMVASTPAATAGSAVPLLNHRPRLNKRTTVYVCRRFTCRLPVTTAEALEAELSA